MAHTVNTHRTYHLLQRRLDRNVTGAPDSPVFMQILRLLFAPDEADIARRLPTAFTPLPAVARKVGMDVEELDERITDMAERGLVVDLERNGRRYVSLAPVVIGFFEFTFMRTRENYPMQELAQLFEEYMFNNEQFAHAVFAGQTQIGRSLVREESLPEGDHVEILDYERASHLVHSARAHAVSLCPCRHHALHLDKACERPLRTCMTLNSGAEMLVRSGVAEEVSESEAMAILEECKEAGLAQTGDNVQKGVSYICNCCGCCCGMMSAIRKYDIRSAIVTSNWISTIDPDLCNGCRRCAKECPVDAIEMVKGEQNGKKRSWAVKVDDLCLGCGVCYGQCKYGALKMAPRERRVFTPETAFDRIVSMAIERGKLGDMLLDNTEGWSSHAMARVLHVLEGTPLHSAMLAVKPLKSAFFNTIVRQGKKASPVM